MMHRAGWAAKEHQQHILAISLPMIHFKTILRQATISSYDNNLFDSHANWKNELEQTEVRLQWDPDHDPYGNKQNRKAIQIGMKGTILQKFCTKWIRSITDITDFVKAEHEKVLSDSTENLVVPYEKIIELNDEAIEKRIGITTD